MQFDIIANKRSKRGEKVENVILQIESIAVENLLENKLISQKIK